MTDDILWCGIIRRDLIVTGTGVGFYYILDVPCYYKVMMNGNTIYLQKEG